MGAHEQLATSLLAGNDFQTSLEPHFRSLRPPGYPLFLLVQIALVGHEAGPMVISQALLGALTSVGVALLGARCVGPCTGELRGCRVPCTPR